MRMETNTERYEGFEQIFDGVQECPVDTEYTLPDYCADIQKILKCIVTPEVTSVSAAGDSLTIDGCASMHVLYLDFPCALTPCGSLKLQTAFRMTVWKQSAKNTMLPAPWAA